MIFEQARQFSDGAQACEAASCIASTRATPDAQSVTPHASPLPMGEGIRAVRAARARATTGRYWRQIVLSAAIVPAVAPLLLAAASPAHAERFEFDQRKTEVQFAYTVAYATQRGRFTRVSGTLDFDEKKPEKTKVDAAIQAASLTTGEPLVDSELKGASFFNVAASPVIGFKSRAFRPKGSDAAEVDGDMTVNGITKPVTLKVNLKPHDDPALKYDQGARLFVASFRISRSAFNMTDYASMVDDAVDITIDGVVRPKR